jgi:hypothetical protein
MSSLSSFEITQKNIILTYTAAKISIYNTTVKSKLQIITVNTVCERQETRQSGRKPTFLPAVDINRSLLK